MLRQVRGGENSRPAQDLLNGQNQGKISYLRDIFKGKFQKKISIFCGLNFSILPFPFKILATLLHIIAYLLKGKCDEESKRYEEQAAQNGGAPPGAFKPDCKEDGSYRAKQCNPSAASCWCVNVETGQMIEGTAKKTFIANIDCSEYEKGSF